MGMELGPLHYSDGAPGSMIERYWRWVARQSRNGTTMVDSTATVEYLTVNQGTTAPLRGDERPSPETRVGRRARRRGPRSHAALQRRSTVKGAPSDGAYGQSWAKPSDANDDNGTGNPNLDKVAYALQI